MDEAIGQLLSLDGQVALVTGAATGLGEAIAGVLAAAGAEVVIGDLDEPGGQRAAEQLRDRGYRAHALRLDVLVNNAGSYHDAGSIIDQTYESWKRAVAVNLEGVFLCSKPAAEHMVARGDGGAIVSISSVDGILPCLGTGYDSAKAAVIHFTRSLAVDLAPLGVRVNGVAPGNFPVETRRKMRAGELPPLWAEPSVATGLMGPITRIRTASIPMGRTGAPAEVGHAVLFLASAAASYITGQTLVVDGGTSII